MASDFLVDIVVRVDELFDIILHKGFIITGVDVFSRSGRLIIQKDMIIKETHVLQEAENAGIYEMPISVKEQGGVWDKDGKSVLNTLSYRKEIVSKSVEKKVHEIVEIKKEADRRIERAKWEARRIIDELRKNGGVFNIEDVEKIVLNLIEIISENDNPYSLLAMNIISYDDYLLNHSINVCTIGAAVLYKFNNLFKYLLKSGKTNETVDEMIKNSSVHDNSGFYTRDEIVKIATGFFLHDIGIVKIPMELINKNDKYSNEEYQTVKKHSYELGRYILKENGIKDPYIVSTAIYHHGPLFDGEDGAYPYVEKHKKIPEFVRICKLVDIYEAMTSKRPYREAMNPTEAVAEIFANYSKKCDQLQLILHSFIQSVGSIPTGSIIKFKNKQKAFVLDSNGPQIILLTDENGKKLENIPEPLDLKNSSINAKYEVDRSAKVSNFKDSLDILPGFIRRIYGT